MMIPGKQATVYESSTNYWGAWHLMDRGGCSWGITPYRTQDDRIEGVVITFVDVCDLKQAEEALRRQQAELKAARTEAENGRRRLAVIVDSPVAVASQNSTQLK
jgi:hypothetical protein